MSFSEVVSCLRQTLAAARQRQSPEGDPVDSFKSRPWRGRNNMNSALLKDLFYGDFTNLTKYHWLTQRDSSLHSDNNVPSYATSGGKGIPLN